ncbi:hypothetical protein [Paludibaculum fermentans]|uniref:hypothetical protein n=1 Tax=Paludibaculum fermentans TaxID=1473598 RepID=UPI003EBD2763
MALGSKELPLFIQLTEAGHLKPRGAVMEIGAQQLAESFLEGTEELRILGELHHAGPCPLPQPSGKVTILHGATRHLEVAAPLASSFWRWLGYEYASVDVDGTPGSIFMDLNYDDVPSPHRGRYQVVSNCGTTEHVANQLNAFKVIHDFTEVGGVMLHNLPAQGMFNHGLVNYNPKFFWMLARSNGYRLLHFSFNSDDSYYALPNNILDGISSFNKDAMRQLSSYKATDCALVVALRKDYDTPYVAPLDVTTGARANSRLLEERYWSVFKPDPFRNADRPAFDNPAYGDLKKRMWGGP